MKENSNKLLLLDNLGKKCGCDFLSDLRLVWYRGALLESIRNIDINQYSIRDWNDCVNYICSTNIKFISKDIAYKTLYDYLSITQV